jgi:hypothetical protein
MSMFQLVVFSMLLPIKIIIFTATFLLIGTVVLISVLLSLLFDMITSMTYVNFMKS